MLDGLGPDCESVVGLEAKLADKVDVLLEVRNGLLLQALDFGRPLKLAESITAHETKR